MRRAFDQPMMPPDERHDRERNQAMSNPLIHEMANKARHDELLRQAERIRAEQAAVRYAGEQPARVKTPFETRLARALALLMAVITPR
jgi:hypothetical protein